MSIQEQFEEAISDFVSICEIAGEQVKFSDFEITCLKVPHSPKKLPEGKMALYAFLYHGEWLKIGIAGAGSNRRFRYHHYDPNSSGSNLANSILQDTTFLPTPVGKKKIGEWIKENCARGNVLISVEKGMFLLRFLEAFMHYRFSPRYEGRRKTS